MQSKAGSAVANPQTLEDKLFADTRIVLSAAVLVYYIFFIRILNIGPKFPNVGWMMVVFLGWSGLLYWSIRKDAELRTEKSNRLKRWLIACSLPVDWVFIYYATIHSGGIESPFFVAVFVLIVFHAYYFPYLNRLRAWRFRWLISGAMAGAFAFLFLYLLHYYLLLKSNDGASSFRLWVSVFFAAILAHTAAFLRHRDRETTRRMRRSLDMAELFRGIIRRVNDLHNSGAEEIQEHFFDDLARTIGENLAAICCEVFSLVKPNEFFREGFWIRETHFTEEFWNLLGECDTVRLQNHYRVEGGQSWRVGRYQKQNHDFAATKNPLGSQMQDFLESPQVQNSLYTIIIRKEQSNERTPIGIIRITNRIDHDGTIHFRGFTDEDEEIIEDVARELSVAFENYRLQSIINKALEKERRMNQLALKDDLDEIMQEILQSMSEMVDASFADLWIPFEEGFEHKRKFVLRSCYPLNGNITEHLPDAKRSLSTEDSFIGNLLEGELGRERIIYDEDIRNAPKYAWTETIHKFGTYKLIAILLVRDEQLGVVCLHPGKDFEWGENIRAQLTEFANLAAMRIEGARFQRRFQQLSTLQKGLDKLFESKAEVFYHNVAEMVKDIMPAETCSIFSVDREKNVLVLSGSSDNSSETRAKIGSIICGVEESVTGMVTKTNEPVMFYGDFYRPGITEKIFEKTQNPPGAMIACPIFDTQNNAIAVIRCINKIREKNIVTNTFSNSDGKLFDLIAGIIATLIENRRNIDSLLRINQQRQNFLSSVAHEFTSPLQSMRSTVEFLKRYHNNAEHLKDPLSQFDFIIEEVDFLNYLITNIRSQGLGERADFLPTSAGPRTNEKLFKIVEKVQTLLKGQAREKGLEIKLAGAFPILNVDKFHLEQVIFNLLVNAIKYTRPNSPSPIEVFCDESANHIILGFRNWGIGVRSNETTRIFEMFERGSNAYISSVTGTGIGLHISKKIMQNLGGDLKLTKLESPTEFTIFLPKD